MLHVFIYQLRRYTCLGKVRYIKFKYLVGSLQLVGVFISGWKGMFDDGVAG